MGEGQGLLQNETTRTFSDFVTEVEPRLHSALIPSLGLDNAREATAEALAWAWEHWGRVRTMDNPGGYLYRVARSKARKLYRRHPTLPAAPSNDMPWVEPGLPDAIATLTDRQRVVVMLVHSFGWTQTEVAEMLGIGHGAVQKHSERGLARLRKALGGEA